jgi:hypothetical protein
MAPMNESHTGSDHAVDIVARVEGLAHVHADFLVELIYKKDT